MNSLFRRAALATPLALLLGALPAHAAHDQDRDGGWEEAPVVSAVPIYDEIQVRRPRQECVDRPVTERTVYRGHSDPGAVLLGGLIGGVIGHQFGGGHGRDVATAAGALIGASHGADRSYQDGRVVERTTTETTCRQVHYTRDERVLQGYDVTYRFHGRAYHTHTRQNPGSHIRVRERMDVEDSGYGDD